MISVGVIPFLIPCLSNQQPMPMSISDLRSRVFAMEWDKSKGQRKASQCKVYERQGRKMKEAKVILEERNIPRGGKDP